jgi:hypothetical protein
LVGSVEWVVVVVVAVLPALVEAAVWISAFSSAVPAF